MKTNSNATAATANRTHALRRHGLKRWHASLHAKTYVFDQHRVFVGSFNLDPRSISLNTETGILIDSSQLATQIEQLFNQACAPERSYRVQSQHLGLRWPVLHWTSQEAQRLIIYKREPHAGWARRLIALMARLLPIEAQL